MEKWQDTDSDSWRAQPHRLPPPSAALSSFRLHYPLLSRFRGVIFDHRLFKRRHTPPSLLHRSPGGSAHDVDALRAWEYWSTGTSTGKPGRTTRRASSSRKQLKRAPPRPTRPCPATVDGVLALEPMKRMVVLFRHGTGAWFGRRVEVVERRALASGRKAKQRDVTASLRAATKGEMAT